LEIAMVFPVIRKLTDHKVGPLDEALEVVSLDEAGNGGEHHIYAIGQTQQVRSNNPAAPRQTRLVELTRIRFQNGGVKENGVNGISIESLLAISIDRLRCFQAGPYACESNANALAKLEGALKDLQDRTRERMARNVEGTLAK
jgi:hypothetical protein